MLAPKGHEESSVGVGRQSRPAPQRQVRMLTLASEIETVLDERSADVCVITDAVAMDDGVYKRKLAQEKDQQNSRVATRTIHRGDPQQQQNQHPAYQVARDHHLLGWSWLGTSGR